MFYKKLGILLLFLVIFLFIPSKSFAKENFQTTYNITYNLSNASSSQAVFDVSILNNTTQFFVSSYKMQLGFWDIKNVVITDGNDKIIPKVIPNDSGTELEINFKNKIVGLNKTRHFKLSFNTDEVSQNTGSIWEVNIPGAQRDTSIDNFNVTVNFPQEMGSYSYIKPLLKDVDFNSKTLKLNKNQIKDTGLSIAFGKEQIYDFSLSYHLRNENFFPITKTIALPPDTSYQNIVIEDMNPKPQNVEKDLDGNWIATYSIPAAKNISVKVSGKAKIFLKPRQENISLNDFNRYISSKQYWESDDPNIQKLAKELKTPQKIYEYVTSSLTYDLSRVKNNQERLGAREVLNNSSSASCWEFTDLFIALSRAAGIPAREVNGYAYTNNARERPLSLVQDVLHAWPQYYDETLKTWVDVDPTWGNTTGGIDYFNTFDYDHIAFVIQGESSTSPIPAGGYKSSSDLTKKDIFVTPSKDFPNQDSELSVSANFERTFISGLPVDGSIEFINTGNSISQSTNTLVSSTLTDGVQNLKIEEVPPFGHKTIEANLGSNNILTKSEGKAKIQLGNVIYIQRFYLIPFFLSKSFYMGGVIIIGILIIGLLISFKRSRRLSSKKH